MQIQLSEHFSYSKLLKFTLPSIVMMIFTSIYGVVDGLFVSNFAGKTAFTAVNFVMPLLMILGCVGFMFGTGGSAIIASTMGAGRPDEAKRQFSLFVYAAAVLGTVLAVLGLVFIRPIMVLLGAQGEMLEIAVLYGRIILLALPALVLQFAFQSFVITAGKPDLGLKITVLAGVTNMVLDALLVGVFPFGVVGAAIATALSQCVGGILPVLYFARNNSSTLRLTKTRFCGRTLANACVNGSSELMSNVAMSLVSMLYNVQLLHYAGEDGVAAYGVLMYVNLVFLSVFIGYSIGSAPIISFHYGAQNHPELQSLRRKSLVVIGICSFAMLAAGELLSRPMSSIFLSYDPVLLDMTCRGFRIYSFSFLFAGLAIWGSSLFTALNNGLVSAVISFLRTLVLQVAAVLLLPLVLGLDGVWLSIVLAELFAAVVAAVFMVALRKKYRY